MIASHTNTISAEFENSLECSSWNAFSGINIENRNREKCERQNRHWKWLREYRIAKPVKLWIDKSFPRFPGNVENIYISNLSSENSTLIFLSCFMCLFEFKNVLWENKSQFDFILYIELYDFNRVSEFVGPNCLYSFALFLLFVWYLIISIALKLDKPNLVGPVWLDRKVYVYFEMEKVRRNKNDLQFIDFCYRLDDLYTWVI